MKGMARAFWGVILSIATLFLYSCDSQPTKPDIHIKDTVIDIGKGDDRVDDVYAIVTALENKDFNTVYYKVYELSKSKKDDDLYLLATLYRGGIGVLVNYNKAQKIYTDLATKGHKKAMQALAGMYYKGQGTKQDYKKAMQWYQKASNAGYSVADFNLGVMYMLAQGEGVNHKKAMESFLKAANAGIAMAQYHAGSMYLRGVGADMNFNKAVKWLKLARGNGSERAKMLLKKYGQ
ncbi:MAG: sel1 repeat family protein [Gammaproteobacteria bacterium]|nr:MAG: sel1 repeat family protein [Gammaproteobacteria bacterium]